MTPEYFFELFMKELSSGKGDELNAYYRFLEDDKKFNFRKKYFIERLGFIAKNITDKTESVWDCGSGYGTTGFYLALNGIKIYGSTIERYFKTYTDRRKYWSQFGDISLFTCNHEYFFDNPPDLRSFNIILAQDTLHHLEPINDALKIFYDTLKDKGRIIVIEENGNNIIQSLMLFRRRGNKRIVKIFDEVAKKDILVGNENIRSLTTWRKLFASNGFSVFDDSVLYNRYYLPFYYKNKNLEYLMLKENNIQRKSYFRKKYFFFGLNFVACKINKNNNEENK